MFPQLRDSTIERADVAEGPRLHHSALHDVQRELGEWAEVSALAEAAARLLQAALDAIDPGAEIGGHQLADRRVGLVQLQREAADGAAVGAIGLDERTTVTAEQREHALDGIVDAAPGRLEQHWPNAVAIGFEDGDQHILLAGEEIIEAAAVDLAAAQYVGDRG